MAARYMLRPALLLRRSFATQAAEVKTPAKRVAAYTRAATKPVVARSSTTTDTESSSTLPVAPPPPADSSQATPSPSDPATINPTSYSDSSSDVSLSPPVPTFHRLHLSPDVLASSHASPDGSPDWSHSYHGLSRQRVPAEAEKILRRKIPDDDIEVKPDGIVYLPEIKYRRILCDAFGPGGWGMVPRGDAIVGDKIVTREYALMVDGRFISQAQGENGYFSNEQLPSAVEGCKSNALMRCCKDLGVASDLWDPVFIRKFRKEHIGKIWVMHVTTKKKKQIYVKKGIDDEIAYPWEKSR